MEELQVIETTSGRQFKPWATKDDVQDPDSVTAIASEIASGKQAIAAAINAKGGSASATESFTELAEAVEEIPNLSDMAKLAGIIAGGNYNKDTLQGHNENVKYGKTEIIDSVGAFETINVSYCFQNWDLLESVNLPNLVAISGNYVFNNCPSLRLLTLPSLTTIAGYCLRYADNLVNLTVGTLVNAPNLLWTSKPNLRNVTIGQDTNINVECQSWTAINVIAEGQSGIDELNSNLQTNLISKLYQGGGKILRLGTTLYDVTTQETRDMVTAKGWTLQRG